MEKGKVGGEESRMRKERGGGDSRRIYNSLKGRTSIYNGVIKTISNVCIYVLILFIRYKFNTSERTTTTINGCIFF